jgi:hypothetical protein
MKLRKEAVNVDRSFESDDKGPKTYGGSDIEAWN